jgi:hypothetical protein
MPGGTVEMTQARANTLREGFISFDTPALKVRWLINHSRPSAADSLSTYPSACSLAAAESMRSPHLHV